MTTPATCVRVMTVNAYDRFRPRTEYAGGIASFLISCMLCGSK